MKLLKKLQHFFLILLMLLVPNTMPLFAEKLPPFSLPAQSDLLRIRSAVLTTNKGVIVIKLFPEEAPWHVANFKYLADKGFYKNLRFRQYDPNVAIQAGAPSLKANSGPGYTLPPEFNRHPHVLGSLSMVRKPNDLDFNHTRRSHGSQFRLILARAKHMDGQFVVFGEVIKGIDVLKKLRLGDIILDLKVYLKSE